jgi:hypothetical protein
MQNLSPAATGDLARAAVKLAQLRKLVCAAHAFGFPLWQNLSPASNGDHH